MTSETSYYPSCVTSLKFTYNAMSVVDSLPHTCTHTHAHEQLYVSAKNKLNG